MYSHSQVKEHRLDSRNQRLYQMKADVIGAMAHPLRLAVIEILTGITYQAAKAQSDPITGQVGGALEGVASSIAVLAVK